MIIHPMDGYVVLNQVNEDVVEDIKAGLFLQSVPASSQYVGLEGTEVLVVDLGIGVKRKVGKQILLVVPEQAIIGIVSEDKEAGEKVVGRIHAAKAEGNEA